MLDNSPLAILPVTLKLLTELKTVIELPKQNKSNNSANFERLSPELTYWIISASNDGAIAYIEADYHGGDGGQNAIVWHEGDVIYGPTRSQTDYNPSTLEPIPEEGAINGALKVLGVVARPPSDEFATVGLGRHRQTEAW